MLLGVAAVVVEADTRVVVDAKIIASVKIVATAVVVARYLLCSEGIFPLILLLFRVFILPSSWDAKQRLKQFHQLTRKESTLNKVL